MNPETKSSGLKYQWPSKFSEMDRRALSLISRREEVGHWGVLNYDEQGMLCEGDPSKWSQELKLKVEKLHDLFEAELKESDLPPAPFLFPPQP